MNWRPWDPTAIQLPTSHAHEIDGYATKGKYRSACRLKNEKIAKNALSDNQIVFIYYVYPLPKRVSIGFISATIGHTASLAFHLSGVIALLGRYCWKEACSRAALAIALNHFNCRPTRLSVAINPHSEKPHRWIKKNGGSNVSYSPHVRQASEKQTWRAGNCGNIESDIKSILWLALRPNEISNLL